VYRPSAASSKSLRICGPSIGSGSIRCVSGFLDEMIPAPWHHRDEPTVHDLMERAHALGFPLDVVVGTAPGWTDPWSRAERAHVMKETGGWRLWLLDEQGRGVDVEDVQIARLPGDRGGQR